MDAKSGQSGSIMSNSESASVSSHPRYVFTMAICFAYFAFGMMDNVRAATLMDVAEITDSTIMDASFGLLMLSSAYCMASLNWSCLYFVINRQAGFIVCLLISASMTQIVPFVHDTRNYWMTQGILGFTFAGIDVAANAWMLEMWEIKSNKFMQCMYFAYALGQTIAPLAAAPFLSRNLSQHHHLTDGSYLSDTDTVHVTDSFILVPYTVAALTAFIAAFILACLFFSKKSYIEKAVIKQMERQRAMEDAAISSRQVISICTISNDRRSRASSVGNYRRSTIPDMNNRASSLANVMPGFRKSPSHP